MGAVGEGGGGEPGEWPLKGCGIKPIQTSHSFGKRGSQAPDLTSVVDLAHGPCAVHMRSQVVSVSSCGRHPPPQSNTGCPRPPCSSSTPWVRAALLERGRRSMVVVRGGFGQTQGVNKCMKPFWLTSQAMEDVKACRSFSWGNSCVHLSICLSFDKEC